MQGSYDAYSLPSKCFLVVALCITGNACVSTMYHWGQYEESIYQLSVAANQEDQKQALVMIQETIQEAESGGWKVPPGAYAYYGYLLLKNGQGDEAKKLFIKEKQLFPESAYFMDSLLKIVEKENPN